MENITLLQSFRHTSKKTFTIAGLISSGFGFFADVLQPIAPFATSICMIASILLVAGLSIQLLFKKNTLALTVFFGFTALTTGLLTVLKTTPPQQENGLFANLIPAIADIQKDLNLIKDKTDEIQKTTEQIEVKTDKIITGIENISRNKGVITNPKSPEDFYHNARFQEISGDYMAARQSYLRYLNTSSDKLDPHLRLITFLKIQEGAVGARESYSEIASRSPSLLTQYTKILLQDQSKRREGLQQFAEEHPDFGPVWYHLSQQFSEKTLGTQTITDKKSELKFSTEFQSAVDAGKVTKYFVDQSLLADWIKDANTRIKAIQTSSVAKQLENPVTLTWSKSNSGWSGIISVSEYAEDIS